MLIDFRKLQFHSRSLYWWRKVERVTEYRYLGTVLDNKLNFNKNTWLYSQKMSAKNRIFCLQKLRSLNVSAAVLRTFYRSCINILKIKTHKGSKQETLCRSHFIPLIISWCFMCSLSEKGVFTHKLRIFFQSEEYWRFPKQGRKYQHFWQSVY